MVVNNSFSRAMVENDGDVQRFSAMVLSAVLMLVMCLGGLANTWLIYLLLKQRLRFIERKFAPFALFSDWCMCCIGAPAFILENLSIIALTDHEYLYWVAGCIVKLSITLFHVLMVTVCFILYVASSAIENYCENLGTRYMKWRHVAAYLVWALCVVVPMVYVAFLVLRLDVVKLSVPRCALDEFYLPVIFICFAAILVCLSAMFAVVYRTRNSRRVLAANIRTSFVVNTGGEEQPCSSNEADLVNAAKGDNSEKVAQRHIGSRELPSLNRVSEERISLEIETSFLDPGTLKGGTIRNRRPTSSPLKKFSFTAIGCYTPTVSSEVLPSSSDSKDGRLLEQETTDENPITTPKAQLASTSDDTEQTRKQIPLTLEGEDSKRLETRQSPETEQYKSPSLPDSTFGTRQSPETEKYKSPSLTYVNDEQLPSVVKTTNESAAPSRRKDPSVGQTNSSYKRSSENGRFLGFTSARSSVTPKCDDKLSTSERPSEIRSSLSSFRSLPSKTSLRLSILNRISEDASNPRNQSSNSFYSRNSEVSQFTNGDGHFETQDLSHTTVSWISIGVLLLSFLFEFLNSLFVVGENRYILTSLSNTMLYVAAASRPFIYIRSNQCLWKHFMSTHFSCCHLRNSV